VADTITCAMLALRLGSSRAALSLRRSASSAASASGVSVSPAPDITCLVIECTSSGL
jgi:hypothetical protein